MNLSADNITAFFTAIAAASGLFFGARSLSRQSKALDAENLLKVMDRSFEAERKFATIKTVQEEEKSWIANEHFNFLEGLACLYNNNLVNKYTKEWCKDILKNNLATIKMMASLCERFQNSVTNQDTYKEIGIFLKKHGHEIEALVQVHGPKSRSLGE